MAEGYISKDLVKNIIQTARRVVWISLGCLFANLIMALAFVIVAVSLSQKQTLLVTLSPTGYPTLSLAIPDVATKSEIQTFIMEATSRIFTFNYGEFLTSESKKRWQAKIAPFFTKKYLPAFLEGLSASGFFQEAVKRRVAVFAETRPPVEIYPRDRRTFEVVFVIHRLETTAEGSVRRILQYRGTVVKGGRTVQNPWGLRFDKLIEVASSKGEPY